MVEVPRDTPSSTMPQAQQSVSWRTVVAIQILLVILGSMVLDGGWAGALMVSGAIVSWFCGAICATCGWRHSIVRVLVWSWVVGVALGAAFWTRSDHGLSPRVAQRAVIGNNEHQLVIACWEYKNEVAGNAWPSDLRALVAWSKGDLNEKILQVRWEPTLTDPLLYVRPATTAPSYQPVVISDPACDRQGMVMVAYVDGHTTTMRKADEGKALWEEAKRLAALPKVRADGIAASDWTVGIEKP